jgi:Zn-dependent protease
VHVSLLVLVGLVALSASATGEPLPVAMTWLGAVFASVVVHELGHAIVARSKGVAVREIDLMAIGGVSRLERLPEGWRDERDIAVAGPLTSIGIALGFFLVAAVAGQSLLPVSPWSGHLLARVGWMNVLLAGFNLLPAFPMDGGRVLRSELERDRSRADATRVAVGVSRWLAGAMIVASFFVSIWLLVIGVFILFAGRAEEAAVMVHDILGPVPARTLAVPCPVALPASMRTVDAAVVAAAHPQLAYPVEDPGGRPLGSVGRGQLLAAGPSVPLGELAAHATVGADDSLERVAEQVLAGPVLVVEHDHVLGVVTAEQVAEYLRHRVDEL